MAKPFFSSLYVAMNVIPIALKNKAPLSGAMFWFYKEDFLAAVSERRMLS